MPRHSARCKRSFASGAYYDVYNALGFGFVESVYQRALPLAPRARGIPSEREVLLSVSYLGSVIGDYRADLVVAGKVIVETKVAQRILPIHETQLLNYLKASTITVGLILNFGPEPQVRRFVLSFPRNKAALIRC